LSFSNPLALWALLLLPLVALVEWRGGTRAALALRRMVGPRAGSALLAQVQPRERRIGSALRLGALGLLALGAAGPQWGRETVRQHAHGSDIVFGIDVSESMNSRDVPPTRLEEARREALALSERLSGCRVGVVAFAGDAARLSPLTLDRVATSMTLQNLSTTSVSTPGTDLGRALETCARMLPQGDRSDQAIVMWTDGEDLEGHAEGMVDRLRHLGVRVLAVGVGTPQGDVIPETDEQGRIVDVKHDEQGRIVHSRLDEKLLRELGRETHGGYFAASRAGGELGRLVTAIGSLARSDRGSRLVERPVARFPLFALLAAALLVAELVRPRRRGLARAAARAAAAAALLACALPPAARAQSAWARGDDAFRARRFARAETLYAQRAKRGAPGAVWVNLATARALLGRGQEAERELSAQTSRTDPSGEAAGYNLGTLLGERHDVTDALAALRRAIERDPNDVDARWNYELLARETESGTKPKPPPGRSKADSSPEPSPSQGGAGGTGGTPQPSAARPQPGHGPGNGGTPPPGSERAGPSGGMSRQQAEQLLGSLEELERLDRTQAHPGTVLREKRGGKDW